MPPPEPEGADPESPAGKGSEGAPEPEGHRSLSRPYVPGRPAKAERGTERPASPAPEPPPEDYIDFQLEDLLAPDEIPESLSGPPQAPPPPGPPPEPAREQEPGSFRPGLGDLTEDLLRMGRQLEIDGTTREVLRRLAAEGDSPAMRDLVEAAFAAGYFAARGELDRRIQTGR